MGERRDRDHERETSFDQRGQQVNGPQFNADQINIGESVSPERIAEGLRLYHEPPPRGMSTADIRRRDEEADLALYGYRHYTRDRERWLRTLPPAERLPEVLRERALLDSGKLYAHHRKILRIAGLPPQTSPADPRYVEAKRKVDREHDRSRRREEVAGAAAAVAVIVLFLLDGSYWLAAAVALPAAFYLLDGHRKNRS
ncbi:hypothetical protein ACIQWN_31025 [Streptomyces vinaceus]|uniref:hypothetical protein n=1 Tax=Streptomyces vinaceus TaxID=1960 RepID=UPI003812A1FE